MPKHHNIRRITALLLALVLLVLPVAAQDDTPPADTPSADGINSVRVYIDQRSDGTTIIPQPVTSREDLKNNPNGTKVVVECSFSAQFATDNMSKTIGIFELQTWQEPGDISSLTPVGTVSVKKAEAFDHRFSIPVDLSTLNTPRLYSKYILAVDSGTGYVAIGDARYIEDVNNLSDAKEVSPTAKTKKGLQVQVTSDAEMLNIGQATVNIILNDFYAPERGNNTEEYRFGGESYYFNLEKIIEYDKKIKPLSDNGILVSAVLLITKSSELETIPKTETPGPDGSPVSVPDYSKMSPIQILAHPGAIVDSNTYFVGINTRSEYGVKYFSALMSFIADRYVRENTGYGRITNVILGDEIGRGYIYNNCGALPIQDYARDYLRALRIADTAVRSRFGGARVYVSMDKYWNSLSALGLPADTEYKNIALFDALSALSVKEGNFPWNLAYHARGEDLSKAQFWKETTSGASTQAPIITMNNISMLDQYVNTEKSMWLDGEPRRILLSEQGFPSGDNSRDSQQQQAAAFAYAYYKVQSIANIEGFIYYRHVDSALESTLNFGLWRSGSEENPVPTEKKAIYDVFKYIDTPRSVEVTSFALPIIGITDWSEVIPGFNADAVVKSKVAEAISAAADAKSGPVKLYRFNTAELSSFVATPDITGLECLDYKNSSSSLDGTKLLAAYFTDADAAQYKGIYKILPADKALDLSAYDYVTINMRMDGADATDLAVMFMLSTDTSEVFEGAASVTTGKDATLTFKVSDWAARDKITELRLWVKSADTSVKSGDFTLLVSDISGLSAKGGGNVLLTVLIIFGGLVVAAGIGFGVLVLRARILTNKRREYRRTLAKLHERDKRNSALPDSHQRIYGSTKPRVPQVKPPSSHVPTGKTVLPPQKSTQYSVKGTQSAPKGTQPTPKSPAPTRSVQPAKGRDAQSGTGKAKSAREYTKLAYGAQGSKRRLSERDLSVPERVLFFFYKLFHKR
ncbi:MAG: DUF5722 domain-containing protein [Eubacteriales bacterium]